MPSLAPTPLTALQFNQDLVPAASASGSGSGGGGGGGGRGGRGGRGGKNAGKGAGRGKKDVGAGAGAGGGGGAGGKLSGDVVRERLRQLHEELKTLDQDSVDISSLSSVRNQLIRKELLLHTDKGVKAYTAACLADLLRLYAPDPPYNDDQLRDIFEFFITQISTHLKPPSSSFPHPHPSTSTSSNTTNPPTPRITDTPFYSEYFYVLQSLAQIRSICIVVELQGCEGLIGEWFEGLFGILRSEINKNFLRIIQEILTALIDEVATPPAGLLEDTLLAQLVAHKDRREHAAFSLASQVLLNNAVKFQRHLHTWIADIHEQHGTDPSETDLKSLEDAHNTLILLFDTCPEILLNVIHFLEETLQGDSVPLRVLTTKTLGAMFGSPQGSVLMGHQTIAEFYKSTWMIWLGRRADKDVKVRLAWIEAAKDVLVNHPELRGVVETGLVEKLTDVEDRVRMGACRVFGQLGYEVATHHVSVHSLKQLGDRVKDKKAGVSEQAFKALGKLYSVAYPELEADDEVAIAKYGWIPQTIYAALFENATYQLRQSVENVTFEYLLPLPSPKDNDNWDEAWVDRLLVLCKSLSQEAFESLMSISNLPKPQVYWRMHGLQPWTFFVQACEDNNGGVIDGDETAVKTKLKSIAKYLSERSADPARTERDLMSFASTNDQRLYKMFKTLMNLTTDMEGVIKTQADIIKRIEANQADAKYTFRLSVRKFSYWILNKSSISPLLRKVTRSDPATAEQARRILAFIGKHRGEMFLPHVGELQVALMDKRSQTANDIALRCLAPAASVSAKDINLDKAAYERLVEMCDSGSPIEGKYAARLLAFTKKAPYLKSAIENALRAISDADRATNNLAPLTALTEFFKRNVDTVTSQADAIVEKVNKKFVSIILQQPEEEDVWVDLDRLDDDAQAKVYAVKMFVQRCLIGLPIKPDLGEGTKKLFGAFHYILSNNGRTGANTEEAGALAGHLRLVAACGLIKFAAFREHEGRITGKCFEEFAYQFQDVFYEIRHTLLVKLRKYLPMRQHGARWYILPFLVAEDPESDNKEIALKLIHEMRGRLSESERIRFLDKPLVRLISLLAHHVEMEDITHESLSTVARYLTLYVEQIARSDNISLLYHLTNRIKTVQDLRYKECGDRVYVVAELAQLILSQKAKESGWTINDYENKQSMPKDIFVPLPSVEAGKELSRKIFLPAAFVATFGESAHKKAPRAPRQPAADKPEKPKRAAKRKTSTEQKDRPKKAAKKRKTNDDDDDTAGEEDSDSDDFDEDDEDGVADVIPKGGKKPAVKTTGTRSRPQRRAARSQSDSGAESSELSDVDDDME